MVLRAQRARCCHIPRHAGPNGITPALWPSPELGERAPRQHRPRLGPRPPLLDIDEQPTKVIAPKPEAALGDGVAYEAQQGRSWRPCSLVARAGRIYGNVKLPKLNVRPSPVSVTFSRLPEISRRFCPGGHVSVDAGRETVRVPVV
jgi:hypothetical protein